MPTVDWVIFNYMALRVGIIENPSGNMGDVQFFPNSSHLADTFRSIVGISYESVDAAFQAVKNCTLARGLTLHRRECHKFTDEFMNKKFPKG